MARHRRRRVRGPALCESSAHSRTWASIGDRASRRKSSPPAKIGSVADVSLRIVAKLPGTTGVFRLDQLIAAAARRTLWLTDAYFAGIPPYVQALRAAAHDGVDVRLLVPGASDIPLLRPLSQAGFRPLLEAGIRVFEWKGPMLHAKTAVADGRWARVGSSNLNIASWLGNYELDVVVENEPFAAAMSGCTSRISRTRPRSFSSRAAGCGSPGSVGYGSREPAAADDSAATHPA